MYQITMPSPIFTNKDGDALTGYLYVGQAGVDPKTNPITVYYDYEGTKAAVQPIRIVNGYPTANGIYISGIFTNQQCSIAVQDNLGVTIEQDLNYFFGNSDIDAIHVIDNIGGNTVNQHEVNLFARRTPEFYGAVGDGVTDDTLAIQAMFNDTDYIYLPNKYKITDTITASLRANIYGKSRSEAGFVIDTDFNLSATYVLGFSGTLVDQTPRLVNFGMFFNQVDQNVRANCTQYPWAINIQGIPRSYIDSFRIEGGWNGIDATGNAGGTYLGFLELGCLNQSLYIDGSLDFFHVKTLHLWPFGMSSKTNLMQVYSDGSSNKVIIGRCDNLSFDELSPFQSLIHFIPSAEPQLPTVINTLNLDGNGARLFMESGRCSISQCYSTKANTGYQDASLHVTNDGILIIDSLQLSSNLSFNSEILADGGEIIINGGQWTFINPDYQAARSQSGGKLYINDVNLNPATITYNQPHIIQLAGSILRVNNCSWTTVGGGSGNGVYFTDDQSQNECSNNSLNGWGIGFATYGEDGDYLLNNNISGGEFFNENFLGKLKTKRFVGTLDGSGNATFLHGVTNLQLKALLTVSYYKGASGEAIQFTDIQIDGSNIILAAGGSGAASKYRCSVIYTETDDSNW